jgi:hypothetical protein
LGNQSENSAGRGQILSILQGNSCYVDQKSGKIWTIQTDLQQIYPKSDRLPVYFAAAKKARNGAFFAGTVFVRCIDILLYEALNTAIFLLHYYL